MPAGPLLAFSPAFPAHFRRLAEGEAPVFYDPAPAAPTPREDQPAPPAPAEPERREGEPDVAMGYAMGGALLVPGGGRVAPPATRGGAGELAPISESRLDLRRLRELDAQGLLAGVLDVIESPEAFEAAMRPEAAAALRSPRLRRGTSRHMLRHLARLQAWGVVEAAELQRVVLPAFTVEKRSGGLRLVCDGRKLNALMSRPPPMLLPGIHALIARFLGARGVVQTDARSWFYQFPLAPGVRPFFGMNLAGARGAFVRAQLRSLCMGWSWAPAIAQRAAMVLLPEEHGACWVDNFFVVGDTLQQASERYAAFTERARWVGAEMNPDPEYGVARSRFVALGLEFDLGATTQRYRAAPEAVEKLLHAAETAAVLAGDVSARGLFVVFGRLVWFVFATGRRLCFLRHLLALVRSTARALVADPSRWDSPMPVPQGVRAELRGVLREVQANAWVSAPPCMPEVVGWSDASSGEWAALLELAEGDAVAQGVFAGDAHIFLKELAAALQATRLAAALRPRHELALKVDNSAAVRAIQRGHSSCPMGNRILCELFSCADRAGVRVFCSWVSTHEQRADEFTRGTVARRPVALPAPPLL